MAENPVHSDLVLPGGIVCSRSRAAPVFYMAHPSRTESRLGSRCVQCRSFSQRPWRSVGFCPLRRGAGDRSQEATGGGNEMHGKDTTSGALWWLSLLGLWCDNGATLELQAVRAVSHVTCQRLNPPKHCRQYGDLDILRNMPTNQTTACRLSPSDTARVTGCLHTLRDGYVQLDFGGWGIVDKANVRARFRNRRAKKNSRVGERERRKSEREEI